MNGHLRIIEANIMDLEKLRFNSSSIDISIRDCDNNSKSLHLDEEDTITLFSCQNRKAPSHNCFKYVLHNRRLIPMPVSMDDIEDARARIKPLI